MYLGNGMVIQSGGWHPDSDVNVDRYRNFFNNAWFFRYDAAKAQDPEPFPSSVSLAGSHLTSQRRAGPVKECQRPSAGSRPH
jgi:hypothetical protein